MTLDGKRKTAVRLICVMEREKRRGEEEKTRMGGRGSEDRNTRWALGPFLS